MTCRLRWHGQNQNYRCRILIRRTFGRILCHVIPEPPATLQGAATWRIQCFDPTVICHIAGCCHRASSTACHPTATYHLQGATTWWIHCHDSRATCHIAGCSHLANQCHDRATLQLVIISSAILKIVFRHILFFLVFVMQFGFDERWLSYRLRYTFFELKHRNAQKDCH